MVGVTHSYYWGKHMVGNLFGGRCVFPGYLAGVVFGSE